jgi:hypothetical protein
MGREAQNTMADPLIGKLFRSFARREEKDAPRRVVWQGQVMSRVPAREGLYLIRLVDADRLRLSGVVEFTKTQVMVRAEDMARWEFLDPAEWQDALESNLRDARPEARRTTEGA